ncbi:MAG: hypothetical protein GC178_06860 [Flavobacteriales bacterium]|nr:hypothetical protein [Flavobacteriales bacterium]
MDITSNHWIFAGIFVLTFVVGVGFAYRDDLKKNPTIFKGSWKFLLGVVLFTMVLVVIKILYRFSTN